MLTTATIDAVVRSALAEDAPWGDATSEFLIPEDMSARADLVAREPGVLAGIDVARAVFAHLSPRIGFDSALSDGDRFERGQVLARIDGPARPLLTGERVALNLVQRMSGVATLTAAYVAAVAGTTARIVDTRKTTPGLRALERHAVVCGGGRNHRFSLSDAVMAKDNHLAVLTAGGRDLTTELRALRDRIPHTMAIEVEVDRLDQIDPVLAAGIDVVMLDNFTLDQLRAGVRLVAGRAVVEASGGVDLSTVRAIAETGVDVISVGALTHSARALDLALDIDLDDPTVSPRP